MIRLKIFPLGVLGVAIAVSAIQGATVKLSDLVNNQETITSGDKLFSNFAYATTGDMPDMLDVDVETIEDADGNFGLRFIGGFIDNAGGSSSDALITFDVEPTNNQNVIVGAVLQANPAVFNGTGLASITETFLPMVEDQSLVVFDFEPGDQDLRAEVVFNQQHEKLSIQKDIILHATGDNSAVTMSFVDQTFMQAPVPEPTAGLLIVTALLGLATFRRKRLA